jgi:hypothetical protein
VCVSRIRDASRICEASRIHDVREALRISEVRDTSRISEVRDTSRIHPVVDHVSYISSYISRAPYIVLGFTYHSRSLLTSSCIVQISNTQQQKHA